MKKFFKTAFIFGLALAVFCFISPSPAYAAQSEEEIFEQLDESVKDQLEDLDMSALDDLLVQLGEDGQAIFGGNSFAEKVQSVLDGEFIQDGGGFIESFFKLLFSEILDMLPLLASIAVIAILCGLVSHMKAGFMSESTGQIVFFVCFAVVVVLALVCAVNLVNVAGDAINGMKKQMNAAFPILLTLMAGIGGAVSVKAYQPAVALLSGGVVEIVSAVVLPLFIFTLVFSVVGNLSKSVRLGKLTDFFKSASTTVLAVTFTVFTAFLAVQGLTAGSFDGVSIRAAKFATKSYIPILGGYLADGLDLILAGSVLIKNSVGVAGLLLLLSTVLMPLLQILGVCFGFKIVAAVIEPVSDSRLTSFLTGIAKSMNMLIAALLAVAFMYFISVMLLIFTSNAFF
ncbi:MAG TPA: stage III sporulation protein AE [Firmicutes bacterium]|nr:stage III sporulation protein AE [Bacillota bacterium]